MCNVEQVLNDSLILCELTSISKYEINIVHLSLLRFAGKRLKLDPFFSCTDEFITFEGTHITWIGRHSTRCK